MARINSLTGTHVKARHGIVRLLEIAPGLATWMTIIMPIILSIYAPIVVAYFIIAFDLYWLLKSFRMSTALLVGHRRLRIFTQLDWQARIDRLEQASDDAETVEIYPVDGVVTEALANTRFRVQLDSGHKVIAHVAGRDAYRSGYLLSA